MAKKASKRKKRKTVKAKAQTKKRINRPAKVFIYALALAALSGGGFLLYSRIKRKKFATHSLPGENTDTIIINNNLPPSYSASSSTTASKTSGTKANDNFPLKKGSRGPRVTKLQEALARIIGISAMNANGGIDGIFGKGTAAALKMAGYSEIIDEATYNRITGSSGSVTVVFNPSAIALTLYRAAQVKNAGDVLAALKQIKSVSEYSSVNDYYKKQAFISKTIVTGLLDYAFANNEDAKTLIRNEFMRIGLKVDDLGKWSLQGFKLFKDLITLRETIVTDSSNNRIPVRKNTILGDEVKIANGMSWFRSIDNSILSVPTQDVKYT